MKLSGVLCAILAASAANADVYTFPAKSVNLGSAYSPAWFKTATLASQLSPATDAHAVHGIELADGGYVLTGKAIESDGSAVHEAFATKFSASGDLVWAWKSGVSGQDAANAAAQLPNGQVVIAGFRNVGGVLKRSITKLNQADGTEIWTATEFGDNSATSNGALEMITVDATHGALAAGFRNKPDQTEMSFKSYGNVAGGEAVVMTLSIADLSAATAPTSANVGNTWAPAGYVTCKTAHYVSSTKVAAMLGGGDEANKRASLAAYNPTDGSQYFLTDNSATIGEGTDMQLVGTSHAVITGQGTPTGMTVGYSGKLTKLSLTDGSRLWTKEYSSCGAGTVSGAPAEGECSKKLIYNECWGVAALNDGGFAISCGTGIENCNGMSGQLFTDCDAGIGDRRPGAYPRDPSSWDAMTIKTDSEGTLEWMRTDSYKAPDWPQLPTAPNVPMVEGNKVLGSTAGEWPIKLNNGAGIAIVTDQVDGVGLLKLTAPATSPPSTPNPPPALNGGPKKILLVGDSWAAYSGNSFTDFCSGAQEINRGIGGTTAVQWSSAASDGTNFASALTAAGTMNCNDRIVLSVGGNDWIGLNPPCQGEMLATLHSELQP